MKNHDTTEHIIGLDPDKRTISANERPIGAPTDELSKTDAVVNTIGNKLTLNHENTHISCIMMWKIDIDDWL